MSDSAARAQRAAALEERKRRLEDLKKRRNRREEDTAKVRAQAGSKANLDEYIDGLLAQPAAGTPPPPARKSSEDKESTTPEGVQRVSSADDNSLKQTLSAESAASSSVVAPQPSPPPPPPKTVETFTISTQTEEEDFPPASEDAEQQAEEKNDSDLKDKASAPSDEEKLIEKGPEVKDPRLLSEEELKFEVSSAPFSSFINTASKKVERILGTPGVMSELLVDYVGETDGTAQKEADAAAKDTDSSRFLSSQLVYECPKWTQGRDVTDMDWSPLHREFLLSTYHMPSSASTTATKSAPSKGSTAVTSISPKDTLSSSLTPRSGELLSDGLACIWSLSMPSRPEHIFTCGSPVTAGRFHPTESSMVMGGCESGQLVVWDVRAGRLPVQKSALTTLTVGGSGGSSKGHTHPICAVHVMDSGTGLVSTSTDGRVNFWSFGNLREPIETVNVGDSASCFAVAPESETLVLGDEHGCLYTVQQSGAGQRRKQTRKLETVDGEGVNSGHYGMITSVSTKSLKKSSASRSVGLSKGFLRGSGGLVLSSGVDWTVKLWAPAYQDKPLLSLVSHSYDYMSQVQWSPIHPSLFATASSNGTVGLWDLAASLEDPLTGTDGIVLERPVVDEGIQRGLNKLQWSPDGRRLAVASADRLHVVGLSDEVTRPKGDEDSKLMNNLISRGLISRQ